LLKFSQEVLVSVSAVTIDSILPPRLLSLSTYLPLNSALKINMGNSVWIYIAYMSKVL